MLVSGASGTKAGSEELTEDAGAYQALQQAFVTLERLEAPGRSGAGIAPRLDVPAVLQVLSGITLHGGSAGPEDAVQVLSVQRARARRFPVVAVLGLVEGEFPARRRFPSLLSPSQRNRLDHVGGGLFVPEADEEAALFVSTVSRASRLLLLSARDAEDDGGQASPSHLWGVSRLLLGVEDGDVCHRTLADQVFAPGAAPTVRQYRRACAVRGFADPPPADSPELRQAPRWERPYPALTTPAVLSELGAAQRFSPSALESYLNCPFAWFVERVIGAEDVDFELDGRLLGQMLHSVLSVTYQRLEAAGLLPLRAAAAVRAREIADDVIEQSVSSEEYPGSSAERRLAACRLKRMARNLFEMEVEAAATLRPLQTEMWVGGKTGIDIGGLRITGRIDRVDASADGGGLFAVDYKSGSIPAASELGTEKALQLPLYLLALTYDHPGPVVLGGAYLSLNDKKRVGVVVAGAEHQLGADTRGLRVLDQAGAQDLFRTTREAAGQAAAGMRAGSIAPRADRRCPPWCKLGPACRAQKRSYRP
jgi:RecB family exonuclease